MSSILTNTSAMVALQTLKSINTGLNKTQSEISTGKTINSAKDNAAVYAISKVMESDMSGYEAISNSLSLGESTLGVAASAAKQVGELLNDVKTKLISSREQNVDRAKLQNEVTSLTAQIQGIVAAAQFNGLNLLDGGSDMTILSSLNRSGSTVSTANITVTAASTNLSSTVGADVSAVFDTTQVGKNTDSSGFGASLDPTDTFAVILDSAVAPAAGRVYSITLNDKVASYTAVTGDTNNEVAYGLREAISALGMTGVSAAVTAATAPGTTDVTLTLTNGTTADLSVGGAVKSAAAGGLAGLGGLAAAAGTGATDTDLATIETLIQAATNVQAAIGTAQSRVELQSDFMSEMIDSFKTGIGSLVDADMEAASARLQALQVQQQLATQSLSIANQAPQNLLTLFR